jgi:succinyl-diaminopimelate desuccinylase
MISGYLDPLYLSESIPFIEVIKESYTSITGDPGKFGLAYGTSYAKAMPNFIAWGPLFSDDEDRCHEKDERFRLTSLMKAGKVYARFLATVALSEKSFKN